MSLRVRLNIKRQGQVKMAIAHEFMRGITHTSIEAFSRGVVAKHLNDIHNKTREAIIAAIINNEVPASYYQEDNAWLRLKTELFTYIDKINDIDKNNDIDKINDIDKNNDIDKIKPPYSGIKCVPKGGRRFHYDFDFIFAYADAVVPERISHVEFKFNAATINKTPQYVSPASPSDYFEASSSYESYFYDNYLARLVEPAGAGAGAGMLLPAKADYLKQVNSPAPACMAAFQALYYKGCKNSSQCSGLDADLQFYKACNVIAKESIANFIQANDIQIEKLSAYLQETQKDKIYMLYWNDTFLLQRVNMDDYIIEKIMKRTKNRYELMTKSGKVMKVLLRWKNGNGIAFPAFQIS